MKVAIIGSRNLKVLDLGRYIPKETIEIVSGGAKGMIAVLKIMLLKIKLKSQNFCRITTNMAE